MAAPILFNVLTNFKFEVGSALLGSKMLQEQVKGISDAADEAQKSLLNIGVGLGTSLGILPTSIFGLFGMAVGASQDFYKSQLDWANIISANMERLTGDVGTFEARMRSAKTIMGDVAAVAQKFSLPERQLNVFTKMVGTALLAQNLEGTNFEVSLDMSRSLLKGAPSLNLDLGTIQGQLLRAIEGGANRNDTLFQRLVTDSPEAFSGVKSSKTGSKAPAFNLLPATKRVHILREALNKFSKDAAVNAARVNTINAQLNTLRSNLVGFAGILRPLGDALRMPIVNMLKNINGIVREHGKKIVQSLSEVIGPMLEDPKKLFINLLQIKNLSKDLKTSGNIFGMAGGLLAVGHGLKFLTGKAFLAHPALAGVSLGIGVMNNALEKMDMSIGKIIFAGGIVVAALGPLIFILGRFGLILPVIKFAATGLIFALKTLLLPLLAIIGLTQLFSRAAAIAKVSDLEKLPSLMADFTVLTKMAYNSFMELIHPFTVVFDAIAEFISPIFSKAFLIEKATGPLTILVDLLAGLAEVSTRVNQMISGITFGFLQMAEELPRILGQIDWGAALKAGSMLGSHEEFKAEMDKIGIITGGARTRILDAISAGIASVDTYTPKIEGKGSVVNRTTNIAKVEINNKFKEQMEPDRIAFTLVDQLQKLASNPTQSKGGSRSTAGLGLQAVGSN